MMHRLGSLLQRYHTVDLQSADHNSNALQGIHVPVAAVDLALHHFLSNHVDYSLDEKTVPGRKSSGSHHTQGHYN